MGRKPKLKGNTTLVMSVATYIGLLQHCCGFDFILNVNAGLGLAVIINNQLDTTFGEQTFELQFIRTRYFSPALMLPFEFIVIVPYFCPPQTVQQDIMHSGVQSKADKSPVTVADYGEY